MLMSWIFSVMGVISLAAAIYLGNGSALAAAIPNGAQAGITLAISISGSICLWSALGRLMEHLGLDKKLSGLLRPVLRRVFPSTETDRQLAGYLSSNICANLLGLGNAATPMGIKAAQRLTQYGQKGQANDQLCRLIVLNTASIQLIPATVASVRASLGSEAPFAILPAVWVSSLCSAVLGILAAFLLGRIWGK